MENDVFVGHLFCFLNCILKSVGLAPFCYLRSRRIFVRCKISTTLAFIISGLIIVVSLPIEIMSAMHFKPNRANTVTYSMGYLHIFFTLIKIWLNQILTIINRDKIINHFNRAIYINHFLKSVCKVEHLVDDQLTRKIKIRIWLFILQCVAIVTGVSAYIRRSFFRHQASSFVQTFICFSYINAIFVTTIYLGGSLMLCDRYCRLLCLHVRELRRKITSNVARMDYLKLKDNLNQTLKAYDVIVMFTENSHNLFASHAVVCAVSTFIICLHGSFTFYCSVQNGESIQINRLLIDFLITACYIYFKMVEFLFIISLSSEVKRKIGELHALIQRTPCFAVDGELVDEIELLSIQMQQEKPSHTFCGIFAFDERFFFSVMVTIVSYLIILIQLDIASVDLKTN